MNTKLLVSTAAIAITAGSVVAEPNQVPVLTSTANHAIHLHPDAVLYSQNSNFGNAVVSQNFTSGVYTSANSAAADDFVVPSGQTWRVTGVDVAGGCFYGGSCAEQVTSEIVTFYRNRRGHPSPRIKKQYTLTCSQASNNFACTIPGKGVRFRAGRHYWVSFVVNCDYAVCDVWGWAQNTTTNNLPGQWENPANGWTTGCTTWTNTSACPFGNNIQYADDYAFDLIGHVE